MGILFLLSCNNEASREVETNDTLFTEETAFLTPEEKLPWIAEFDSITGDFVLKHQKNIAVDTLDPRNLINDINAVWEDVKLVYKKVSHDTLYVAIPESEALTQRMGSAGASGYIASVTYSLTEIPKIRWVHYNFEEGDHASPGTYGRADFKNYH